MAQLRRCRSIITSSVSSVSSEASERVSVHMLPVDVQGVRPRLSCRWCMWGQGGRLRGQGGRPGRQAVGPGRQAWNQWGQGGRLWDVGSSRVTRANMRARTHMQHVHAHACPHRHTHKHTDTCAHAHIHTHSCFRYSSRLSLTGYEMTALAMTTRQVVRACNPVFNTFATFGMLPKAFGSGQQSFSKVTDAFKPGKGG